MNAISSSDNKEVLQRIANWRVAGVSEKQIGQLLGVDESRVSQLVSLPEYAQIEVDMRSDRIEMDRGFNDLADAIEQTSGQTLFEQLKYNKDPEFALKVYAVANKAKRRSVGGNNPIEGNTGMRAVISMPMTFINKLQMNGGNLSVGQTANSKELKRTDMLRPAEVERMLMAGKKDEEDIFDGIKIEQ